MRLRLALGALLLIHLVVSPGCAAVIVAGGATAAVVANDRRTLGVLIDDENIEIKARARIAGDETLRENVHVNVTSLNGVVLLSGETAAAEQRDRVLARTRDVPGVRRTVNEIRIAAPAPFASRSHDTLLTTKVKSRLLATENLDSANVKVVTESSVVYLMGLMKKDEAEKATEATRDVGGVERIVKLFEYLD